MVARIVELTGFTPYYVEKFLPKEYKMRTGPRKNSNSVGIRNAGIVHGDFRKAQQDHGLRISVAGSTVS